MQNNHIVIKEQQKDWLLKGIIYLGLMVLSLIFAFVPLFSGNGSSKMVFYIIGGLAFTVSTTLFVLLLYKVCNPGTALILNAHGFVDKKNVGDRIVVDWTNISSIKQLGKKELPYLGISLENADIVLAQMKSKEADAMRENFNNNLPAILIAQNEIRMPIKDLKELFTKYAREARALATENEQSKHKVNPYSTDDVIKNFQSKTATEEVGENKVQAPITDDIQVKKDEAVPEQEAPVIANNFYEELLKQAEAESDVKPNTETTPAPENSTVSSNLADDNKESIQPIDTIPPLSDILIENDGDEPEETEKTIVISEEFTDILNQARSAKILELDKILNDRNDDPSPSKLTIPSIEKNDNNTAISQTISISDPEPVKSEIKIADLESMIENALQSVESKPKSNISGTTPKIEIDPIPPKNDVTIPEPDLSKAIPKTKKKKSFVLNEKK